MLARVWILLLGLCASCTTTNPSVVRIAVGFDNALGIDRLRIEARLEGSSSVERMAPAQARPLSSGFRVVLLVPNEWLEHTVQLKIFGLSAETEKARGVVDVTPRRAETVDVSVTLCMDACVVEEAECEHGKRRTCELRGACAAWIPPVACAAETPYCSNGRCSATCTDECEANAGRCDGTSGFRSCGQHDDDSCLDWGAYVSCGVGERCRSKDGACVPDCGATPCACKAGETRACPDVGQCKTGLRKCEDGVFGPCRWQVGPTPEVCDGQDNDCDGRTDEELTAEGCAKQEGVCAGSTKRCGGSAGWLACDATRYQANAKLLGSVYESKETRCDGKDNDCNGETDELSTCALNDAGAPDTGSGAATPDLRRDSSEPCKTGDKDCRGEVPRICASEQWLPQSACSGATPVCAKGECVACAEGAAECANDTPRICLTGNWQTQASCSGATPRCEGARCVMCVNGTKGCGGNVPQLCERNTWKDLGSCSGTGQYCEAGACVACPTGRVNCNDRGSDACEKAFDPATLCQPCETGTLSCYRDRDGDHYGNPSESLRMCGTSCPSGYVTDRRDCDDKNPGAHPGVKTSVKTLPSGATNWDINCDGEVTPTDSYGTPYSVVLTKNAGCWWETCDLACPSCPSYCYCTYFSYLVAPSLPLQCGSTLTRIGCRMQSNLCAHDYSTEQVEIYCR